MFIRHLFASCASLTNTSAALLPSFLTPSSFAFSPSCTHRLVKRVVDIGRPTRDEKTANHVPLDVVLGVLQQQGTDIDMDELECMLTVAISSKYIKGYISNKAKVLVLAKPLSSAFPEACPEWWVPMTAENAVP